MKHFVLIALVSFGINTNSASAQSLQECADAANLYCMKFFNACFQGRQYQQISVSKANVLSANSMVMAGTVTFIDALGLPKSNYFEMSMTMTPYNTMDVKFSKLNQVLGSQYWEYCNNVIPIAQQTNQPQTAYNPPTSQTTNSTSDDLKRLQNRQLINNQMKLTNDAIYQSSRTVANNFKY